MRKKHLIIFGIFVGLALIFTGQVNAQENNAEQMFKARVLEVIEERTVDSGDGNQIIQQDLMLEGLEGEWNNKEIEIKGINDFQILGQNVYQEGDKVLVTLSQGPEGKELFFITDYVRTGPLLLLTIIFIVFIIWIGRKNGARALVMLFLSFVIILGFIVPKILGGSSPMLISTIGAVGIMFLAIFGTEGFNKKSKIAFFTILFSLVLILIFSSIFTELTRLTGLADEDALLLVGAAKAVINMKGLLLAGFIIGTLGVLDDVVISQVSLVKKLAEANKAQTAREVYKKAMDVGTDHINAIVNTLFLAYAGASLPLLMLFSINEPPFLTFAQVVNNELIATEIVRTLVGSICLVLSMPVATWFAVRQFVKKEVSAE